MMGGGKPCDLSVKKPRIREISNCISARTDRSISNLQQEGTGVVETYWIDENRVYYEENYCACISAREYKDPLKVLVNENKSNEVKQIGNVSPKRNEGSKWQNPSVNRVYDSRFISPTINTMQGGNRQPMIVEK